MGSEMCIRDREITVHNNLKKELRTKLNTALVLHKKGIKVIYTDAVSYTHLTLPTIYSV